MRRYSCRMGNNIIDQIGPGRLSQYQDDVTLLTSHWLLPEVLRNIHNLSVRCHGFGKPCSDCTCRVPASELYLLCSV